VYVRALEEHAASIFLKIARQHFLKQSDVSALDIIALIYKKITCFLGCNAM
jgi:hypothetical protein